MKYFFSVLLLTVFISNVSFGQQATTTHKVLKGENITQIAQNHKTTPAEIYKLNPEAQGGISENQILNIPERLAQPKNTIAHIVAPKETLYGLATKYKVKVEAIQTLNAAALANGMQIGEELFIPEATIQKTETVGVKSTHLVQAKESLFSIARQYNVSVEDLDKANSDLLKDGLQIGQEIKIPNKKKTLDGRVRVINDETIFHVVKPKETKYSIAKQFGISVAQLESQNPEIVNGLIEGNKLAINVQAVKPTNENEELMIALAEKQVVVEKSKAKEAEIEKLSDKLYVQRQINQKVLKINSLQINLDQIDVSKEGSVERLKLVLEANKNIQDVLISKLDSLVYRMNEELDDIKNTEITNIEDSKRLEKISYDNIAKTSQLSTELKKELAENRKVYTGFMNKAEQMVVAENLIYKKKVRENQSANAKPMDDATPDKIKEMTVEKLAYEQKRRDELTDQITEILESIDSQKKVEIKRHISKAVFYTQEARDFDDKVALVKLERYKTKAEASQSKAKMNTELDSTPSKEKIKYVEPRIETCNNLKAVNNGYYLVIDSYKEASERDHFIMQLIDSGELNSSFFFNVNALVYYVYTNYYKTKEEVIEEYKQKSGQFLYDKMFIVKIENE
ncbi:LysM peptidoglycan-binding domain-containing protein [Flavobacterium limnophilum]|uniref:LysM peptidoglycan-binding domain-containing protein n=1 Tax=Flavobacterium limnophilum TaxID=3003262 RepID=UPI0024821FFF|nr:LysM peptidoglycan-binding domain-containing protein [Flavobacterium limnophilum]